MVHLCHSYSHPHVSHILFTINPAHRLWQDLYGGTITTCSTSTSITKYNVISWTHDSHIKSLTALLDAVGTGNPFKMQWAVLRTEDPSTTPDAMARISHTEVWIVIIHGWLERLDGALLVCFCCGLLTTFGRSNKEHRRHGNIFSCKIWNGWTLDSVVFGWVWHTERAAVKYKIAGLQFPWSLAGFY